MGVLSMARGATPRPRSGAEAGRTPCPKGSSQEELPHVRGQGQWLRVPGCNGAGTAEKSYPSPRSGAVARRSYPTSEVRGGGQRTNPTSKEWWLHRCKKAYRSYPKLKVRRGGAEEIPFVQGKEQWLHFAGATVKRYPKSKVRETQVRW